MLLDVELEVLLDVELEVLELVELEVDELPIVAEPQFVYEVC